MHPVETLVRSRCILGEGPLWVSATRSIYWVDIKSNHLYCFDTVSQVTSNWCFEQSLTSIVERASGGFFGTSCQGFVDIDLENKKLHLIDSPEIEVSNNRHNPDRNVVELNQPA